MKIVACYIRVSTAEENQTRQRREINRWLKKNQIKPQSVRWYVDKPSKHALDRLKFQSLQTDILDSKVRAVVVWRLDRLSDKMREGLNILIDWCDKSLRVVSVSQHIDFKSGDHETIASILRGVAELDEQSRRERTRVGLAAARARGRAGGRPRISASESRVRMAKKLQRESKLGIDQICARLKISRSTYYRYVEM